MRSKIAGCVLVVFFFLGVSAYAEDTGKQWGGGKGPRLLSADDIVEKMKAELNLTDEQSGVVKPIIEENMARRRELKQSFRNQMEQLNQDENQKLSQVLNQDQMSKWNEKHMKGTHKHGSHDAGNESSVSRE